MKCLKVYVSSLIIYGRYATKIFQRETMLQKLYKTLFVTMFPACVLHWKSSLVAKRIVPFNTRSVKKQTAENADCRLQTESKTQAGGKMEKKDCRLFKHLRFFFSK